MVFLKRQWGEQLYTQSQILMPSITFSCQSTVKNANFWYIVVAAPCLCACVCVSVCASVIRSGVVVSISCCLKAAGIQISQRTSICRIPGLRSSK